MTHKKTKQRMAIRMAGKRNAIARQERAYKELCLMFGTPHNEVDIYEFEVLKDTPTEVMGGL